MYGIAPVTRSTTPMQFGPTTEMPVTSDSVARDAARSVAAPPESVKPPPGTITAPAPIAAASSAIAWTRAVPTRATTASGAVSRSEREATVGTPATSEYLPFTGTMSPPKR